MHHKNPHDLEFELAYLDYLKNSGFPYEIPTLIATRKGDQFVTVQGHYYWLYKFLEGNVVEKLNDSYLEQVAKMIAEYHKLIQRSALNNGKPVSDLYNRTATLNEIEEYRTEILRKNKIDRKERIFLDESARMISILRDFGERPQPKLELYPIHRDLISENLIWKQGKLAGVIDFEHVSQTNDPLVKDIAVVMQYCCRDSTVKHRLDIGSASRVLGSYRKSRTLSDEEVELIPNLISTGFIEDVAFAFWMLQNNPERAKQSEEEGFGLTLPSRAADWVHSNRKEIAQALLNDS